MKAFALFQAVGRKGVGLKAEHTRCGQVLSIFPDRESAREYLRLLLMEIKREQGLGLRTKDNLNPETGLDFLIDEVDIVFNEDKMTKRGWRLDTTKPNQL